MHVAQSQHNLTEDPSPVFSAGRKLSEMEQALLWSVLQEDRECPSRVLLDKLVQRQVAIALSLRHGNRWRPHGGSIVARAARVTRTAHGRWPLVQRSSGSLPLCHG